MSTGSYGPDFNSAKGGVFGTWLQPSALRIYWWSRDKVPSDVLSENLDPSTWGTPASQFLSGGGCDVGNYFKKQTIVSNSAWRNQAGLTSNQETLLIMVQIINTAFCGENIKQELWDDSCKASTGAPTCDDYVTRNPTAFSESYWLLNSIKLYDLPDATESRSKSNDTGSGAQSVGPSYVHTLQAAVVATLVIAVLPG